MNAPILVTGGTGTIGRRVVPLLRAAGREVRILSRRSHEDQPGTEYVVGDTVKGRGLDQALHGTPTVLHLAGGARGDDRAAVNLATAARRAGVQHFVLISVTGADRMPIGYFRAKSAAEVAVQSSGVPFTVVRVAQLHDFVLPVARLLTRLPVVPAPRGLRFEPVDVDEVAEHLAGLTLGEPSGRVTDLAGPQVLDLDQLLTQYLAPKRRRLVGTPVPGAAGRAYRAGHNLAGPQAQRTSKTWQQFLDGRQ